MSTNLTQMQIAEMQAEMARLKAENEAVKAAKSKSLVLKVSEKGAVMILGINRFPVTLYPDQWLKVLDIADQLKKFIEANKAECDKRQLANAQALKTG